MAALAVRSRQLCPVSRVPCAGGSQSEVACGRHVCVACGRVSCYRDSEFALALTSIYNLGLII